VSTERHAIGRHDAGRGTAGILIVAATPELLTAISAPLSAAGYPVQALLGPIAARDAMVRPPPVVQVLDAEAREPGGTPLWAAFRRGRRRRIPTLLVTHYQDGDDDSAFPRIPDDCIVAPFRPAELLYRVERLIRQSARPVGATRPVRLGELEIDLARRAATLGGVPVALGPAELGVLLALARQPNVVHAANDLVVEAGLKSTTPEAGRQTLRTAISRLRHKLESDPAHPRYVHSVRRGGYLLGLRGD
jgi:two-component system KDP operon response regulator KdpE